ncbi:MAG: hypothetical protein WCS37_17010 [Chloroflexota bacterium]|nr:hypothetical protein [Chloroflexota bacterium]
MKTLQKIIVVDTCKNLYNLIAAMGDARADEADNVMLWSQGSHSTVFSSVEELELIEQYARKFGLKITLSAANDPVLRRMAAQVGWKVMWQIAELDDTFDRQPLQPEIVQWQYRREPSGWQVAG